MAFENITESPVDMGANAIQQGTEGFAKGAALATSMAQAALNHEEATLKLKALKDSLEQQKDDKLNDTLKAALDPKASPALQKFHLAAFDALMTKFGRNDDGSFSARKNIAIQAALADPATAEGLLQVSKRYPGGASEFLKLSPDTQKDIYVKMMEDISKETQSEIMSGRGAAKSFEQRVKDLNDTANRNGVALDPVGKAIINNPGIPQEVRMKKLLELENVLNTQSSQRQKEKDELQKQNTQANIKFKKDFTDVKKKQLEQGDKRIANAEFGKIDKALQDQGNTIRNVVTDIQLISPGTKVSAVKWDETLNNFTAIMTGAGKVVPQGRSNRVFNETTSELSKLRLKVHSLAGSLSEWEPTQSEIKTVRDAITQLEGIKGKYFVQTLKERVKQAQDRLGDSINPNLANAYIKSKQREFGVYEPKSSYTVQELNDALTKMISKNPKAPAGAVKAALIKKLRDHNITIPAGF